MIEQLAVHITVYHNAAKAEVQAYGKTKVIGWFRDEVASLAAVSEWALMQSAILPCLKKMPELTVKYEYKPDHATRPQGVTRFVRETAIKLRPNERRVVLLPGASGKPWLCV